jgi:uncharacterized membrane protein
MSQHTTVVIIGSFADSEGAERALRQIHHDSSIRTHDAAWVVKSPEGKLHVTDTRDWGWGKGALWGGLAGALITIVAPPVGLGLAAVGGIVGGVGAAASDAGLSNPTLKALGQTLAAGSSAAVLMVDPESTEVAEAALTSAGAATVREGFGQEVVSALRALDKGTVEDTSQTLARDLNNVGRAM